jgi:UPF0176 protein
MDFRVLLYYWFTRIEDPRTFAEQHFARAEELGLKGRILIAAEGINGTVSGTAEACQAYMDELSADPRFHGIEFKVDEADQHAFKALHVRIRPEIITLGKPLSTPVHERTGPYLQPAEWKEMMEREDVVVLDGRNAYESELGRFKNAICPPVQNFRDLPDWILNHREELEGKTILTYCTGGIRCEKLTAWMLAEGFKDVYQLHGGIVMYGKDEATQGEGFEGVNVVFDERIAVPVGPKAEVVTTCRECGQPSANYVNCANVECNLRMIQCPACEAETGRCCSEACRQAPRKREKGLKWHETRHRPEPSFNKRNRGQAQRFKSPLTANE